MDLNWLRKEISKKQEDISWIDVLDTVNKIYKEESEKNSFLGISKGFLNFIKVSYYANDIADEIKQMYPNVKIYHIRSQSEAIKLIKDTKDKSAEVDKQLITNNLVVFISDKNTIETVFNRYKLPFVKYYASRSEKRPTLPDGSKYDTLYRWRRDGEKSLTWGKGQSISIKRDNLLDELFEMD